jgi:enamine deaminase RidA (YjgF/YER057c/UK114 family)
MMSSVAQRLSALGLTIPEVVAPLASYMPARVSGSYVFTAGQLPMVNGELPVVGRVGADVTAEQAKELASTCALNAIAAIASVVDLDRVTGIVKVVGFVASTPDFTGQPGVVDGASELLSAAFGEAGRHARSAVGVASLPRNAPVEVEVIAEIA